MLTMLYKFLLRFRKQDEVSADMLRTFEEARTDARTRGFANYCGFAIREILGLLGAPAARERRWPLIAGWGAAGLAVGIIAAYMVPAQYTSSAALHVTAPLITENLYGGSRLKADDLLEMLMPVIRSRTVMTTIINNFGLYPNDRQRRPIEDVIERMRKDTHIAADGANTIVVSFTYGDSRGACAIYDWREADLQCDRYRSQRVAQDLVARLIDENIRSRANQTFQTQRYFEDRVEAAGKELEKLGAQLRSVEPASPHYERLMLDRELARKDYEALHEKLGASNLELSMEGRKMGRLLELLDPASLPQGPDTSPVMIALAGLVSGLVLGAFLALVRTLHRRPELLLPMVAEG
jgi:uncharacterized protein involved in exopolysaccharide biosynthesis